MSPRARILVVDDDPSVLEALGTALAARYEVLRAPTAAAALDILTRHAVDLVLLDYLLPDMSGLNLLRVIKGMSPSLLVILMTAFGSEEVSVDSFRGGARDYLRKPFTLPSLMDRIERLLGARAGDGEARVPVVLDPERGAAGPPRGRREAGVQRAMAFIEERLHAPLTLEEVARQAGMSRFRFCRACKDSTGLTFREYLARRRISRAAELLRDRRRSVTEVCLGVGLKDLAHLGRIFRKLTGHPSSPFRPTQA